MRKMRKVRMIFILLFLLQYASAQNSNAVEMADLMRQSGKIYVVVGVLCIIFLGIVIYLFSIDRKLNKLEKELRNKP
jgi:CcmD family protein